MLTLSTSPLPIASGGTNAITAAAALTSLGAQAAITKGQTTLVAGTVTVANTAITATSVVVLTVRAPSATIGILTVTLTAGTGFTITSTSNADTSGINYAII